MRLAALATVFDTLALHEPEEGILVITLNRPALGNALNTRMAEEILSVYGSLEAEPDAYRCAILTGAGDRVFCAGGDLKERDGMSDEVFAKQHYLFERMFRAMINCPTPVIAAINGAAFAGGLEMALCCDFAYAVKTARFALTEVTRGIMPGGGGTQNLPRIIGERRAKEIILTGKPFGAVEALNWGIVNRLCERGQVLEDTLATARIIRDNAPLSVRQAKKAITQGLQMDRASGMLFEIEAYYQLIPTEDRLEGIKAFNEKRKPVFKGR